MNQRLNRALFLSLVLILLILTGILLDIARGPLNRHILSFFDVCPGTRVMSFESNNQVTQSYVDFKGHTVTVIWQLRYRDAPVMIERHARPMPNVCAWYQAKLWNTHGAYTE